MGVFLVELGQHDALRVQGYSTVSWWRRGVLPRLLDAGYSLPAARIMARHRGALAGTQRTHNLVVTRGKQLIADLLIDSHDNGLTYHALGTDATAPAAGQTALVAEVARKAWTARERLGAICTFSVFYLASEASYDIEECGVFGGPGATSTLGSGRLFSRYLQPVPNAGGDFDLTFDYELEVT